MVRDRLVVLSAATVLAVAACGGSDTPGPADDGDVAVPTQANTAPVDVTPTETDGASTDTEAPSEQTDARAPDELFPDVVDATATFDGDTWTIAATLSSPYDSPERYADAWRVFGPDATVYGERILTHDHANEQPFTRSQSGIEIPDEVTEVTIEGRDQVSGYGGETFTLQLTR